jgi:hypothetical protein
MVSVVELAKFVKVDLEKDNVIIYDNVIWNEREGDNAE